jgi:hypothetical protein
VRPKKGLAERLNGVLKEIENFMIDLKSVHLLEKLNDERGWDGLYKIAMHWEGEDRVAAVRALARLGHRRHLETIGTCHIDPLVASAAVAEIAELARFKEYTGLGDPYSEEAYMLGRMVTDANTHEARCVALLGLTNLTMREAPLGDAARLEMKRLSAEGVTFGPETEKGKEEAAKIVAAARARESPDDGYQTNAWWTWNNDRRLQRLNNEIESLAELL